MFYIVLISTLILFNLEVNSEAISSSQFNLKSSTLSLIIGGHRSPKRPFFVKVNRLVNGKRTACGGTIIHTEWVLTAGHCIHEQNSEDVVIEVGDFTDQSSPKTEVNVTAMYEHQFLRFSSMRVYYDIGIIRVSNYSFPQESILEPCPYFFELCAVLATCGMGKLGPEYFHNYSDHLREIFLRERTTTCWNKCPNDVICTTPFHGHTDDNIYHGDSGGPLYVIGDFPNPEPLCVYGVTSYIGKFAFTYAGVPIIDHFLGGSFFSSVPFFYEWIVDGMANFYVERGMPQPGVESTEIEYSD